MAGMTTTSMEDMARTLEESGDYKVLRRLNPSRLLVNTDVAATEVKTGLMVDVETTGLQFAKHEIIELAMVPFKYTVDGRIVEIGEAFEGFHQPAVPISEEITRLTGITNAMVAGARLDVAAVAAFAASADLVIAHNAGFDRPFLERLSEVFVKKPWACSMSQVAWAAEGFEGTKLSYLLNKCGYFHDGHRAANDCLATLCVLNSAVPSGGTALAQLLGRARKPTWRIWAENSPFDLKHILKDRGYRWNGDSNPNPRAWYTDVEDEMLAEELRFLREEIYQRDADPTQRKITAYERFSIRG